MTYREPVSAFSASWDLPDGYYVGSIQFRRWHTHSPIAVYLCYEAQETIEGKSFLVASGHNGEGDNFLSALASAKEKVDKSLTIHRERLRNNVLVPPKEHTASPKPYTQPLPEVSGLKFDL